MNDRLSESELAAYFALRRAADRLQRAVTGQLRAHGLTEVQFAILAQLSQGESGLGMTELARALVVSKSGLTYQAGQLEGRELVVRIANEGDDRGVLLQLTGQGRELLARVLPGHVALVRELFVDRVDPHELAIVRDALEAVATDSGVASD